MCRNPTKSAVYYLQVPPPAPRSTCAADRLRPGPAPLTCTTALVNNVVVPDRIESMNGAPPAVNPPGLKESVLKAALMHPQGSFHRVEVVSSSGSTNTDLAADAADKNQYWPDLSVLIADAQPAGKGRMGRSWEVPAGAAMISSVFVRPGEQRQQTSQAAGPPSFAATGYGWLSILAGVALCESLNALTGVPAELKWPNDVVVRGRKLAGILAQVVPFPVAVPTTAVGLSTQAGPGVVVGVGVNVTSQAHELPSDRATSLLMEGAALAGDASGTAGCGAENLDRNVLLPAYLNKFSALYKEFVAVGGDAQRPLAGGQSVLELAQSHMSTLGQDVRAELPGGTMLYGTAIALGADGGLLIRDAEGTARFVNAGDVIHLRRTDTDGTVKYA